MSARFSFSSRMSAARGSSWSASPVVKPCTTPPPRRAELEPVESHQGSTVSAASKTIAAISDSVRPAPSLSLIWGAGTRPSTTPSQLRCGAEGRTMAPLSSDCGPGSTLIVCTARILPSMKRKLCESGPPVELPKRQNTLITPISGSIR